MNIEKATQAQYTELLNLWEASVRATHDFLAEEDLLVLKLFIYEQFLCDTELRVVRGHDSGIIGFSGVNGCKIELLFIAPAALGKGVGTALVKHAVKVQGATKVDVNEQNEQALAFYRYQGFSVVDRSPVDGLGKPYPLLHMALG